MTNADQNRDPLATSFRELPTLAMPEGLADKIMGPIEAEMGEKLSRDMQVARARRKMTNLQPYAAALALIALGLGVALFLHPLQQPNGNVTVAPQTVAQNPGQKPTATNVHQDNSGGSNENDVEEAMPTDLSPGNHHVPQGRVESGENATNTSADEELASLPQDDIGMGAHLSDIGADPLQSNETSDDPVMTLIGF